MIDWVLWIKAGHVVAVITWMAGLFYVPRLFAYHSESVVGSKVSEVFKVMERRLLAAIVRPALVMTVVFGVWAGVSGGWFDGIVGWLMAKLLLVGFLVVFHGRLEWHAKLFARDVRRFGSRYFRVLNEIPTVLLVGIVILVVVKPF